MFKVGMTRRLEPFERVQELGDASVPFPFDVHAMIFSENAPGLEARLHQEFVTRRVNRIGARKEYFRTTLDEIQSVVKKHHGLVTFQLNAEAEEFRKTLAASEGNVTTTEVTANTSLPKIAGPQGRPSQQPSAEYGFRLGRLQN